MNRKITAFVLICFSIGAQAAVVLEITADSRPLPERLADAKITPPPQPSSTVERVLLDGDKLVVESDQRRIVIDFVARKKYVVVGKLYSEQSLFADVGFRFYELMNRERLAELLKKAVPEKPIAPPALEEHELSIARPDRPATRLEQRLSDDDLRFVADDITVFTISTQGEPLSAEDARNLARYFRYFRGGHPIALAELQKRNVLPARIIMLTGAFHAAETTLRFKRLPVSKAPEASLAGLSPIAFPELQGLPKDIVQTAFRIGRMQTNEIEKAAQEARVSAEQRLASGDAFGGYLLTTQYLLQTGKGVELLRERREFLMNSADFRNYSPYFSNARSKEEAERAIAILEEARKPAGDTAYILGIFQANHHIALNRPAVAVDLFANALRSNPLIAGAWKDMGEAAFRQFLMPAAWLCWDTGRKISPTLPMFDSINRLEERLLKDFPEYF